MNPFVITTHLRSSFRAIGACVRAMPLPDPRGNWRGASAIERRLNVHADTFELTLTADTRAVVLDCRRTERHLVLSLQEPAAAAQRFLCGFDERHWFAAAV